jgi:antitoxin MazE
MPIKSTIRTWGNSLAVRIPKSVSEDLGIGANAAITMSIDDGALVIAPVTSRKKRLQKLLSQITEDNLPEKKAFGRPIGREMW